MTCVPEPDVNLQRAIHRIREAAAAGAQVVCLQEVFNLQYPCQAEEHDRFALAEPIPGPTTVALQKIAKELSVVLVVPLFEHRTHGLYHNSAVVLDADGSIAGLYRKMHIPDDPLYLEKFYFAPGDLGFLAFPTRYARIGVCICWDQWYPEAARLTAMQGAEMLFYPTAIGWDDAESGQFSPEEAKALEARHLDAWITIQRSHAIANGIYVAAANRVGREGHLRFWGNSFIAAPGGEIIARMDSETEGVIFADIDPSCVEMERRVWPFLRDRRIDAYQGLLGR